MAELYKGKQKGNSTKVTLGDPKDFTNKASDTAVNTGRRPQLPPKEQ